MLDLVGRRYWYFLLSLAIILPGVVSMLIPPGLVLGIEFTSGTSITLRFEEPVEQADLRGQFTHLGHGDAIIQHAGEGSYLVRTRPLGEQEVDEAGQVIVSGEMAVIKSALEERFGGLEVLNLFTVSPLIATEIMRNAALAVALGTLGILLYITFAFRRVPNAFRYGTCAVIAMFHDVLVVVGLFSIFGKLFGTEVDSMFITALLTIIGFSVHDTIVVFDRIRENLGRRISLDFETVVNVSLIQTLARSMNTSLTVVLTLVALYLFGGVTIRTFVLTLLIGVVSGTYSSIFNASQLLVVWEKGEFGLLWRRLRRHELRPAAARRSSSG